MWEICQISQPAMAKKYAVYRLDKKTGMCKLVEVYDTPPEVKKEKLKKQRDELPLCGHTVRK